MKTQRGLGMIEVMVAMTIGLFLLLGVSQAFNTMRQTSLATQQLSAVQNQQRMAMYFLHVAVSGAGFNPDPITRSTAVLYPALGAFVAGQTLSGTGAGASADTLSVRFTASVGGAQQGCAASLTAGDSYTDTFSFVGGFLQCVDTDNTVVGAVPATVSLVSGLAGMNVVYGVDSNGGGSVTQYLTATQVSATGLWASVKTAQVTLLFANALAGQPGQPQTVQLVETIPFMANI